MFPDHDGDTVHEECGVFGAPTYVLDGERFWGQDRLDFLDRALALRAAVPGARG